MNRHPFARPRALVIATSISLAGLLIAACGQAETPAVRVVATASVVTTTATPTAAAPATTPTPTPAVAATSCTAYAKAADPFLLRVVDKQRALPSDFAPADRQLLDDQWAVPGFPGQSMRAIAIQPMAEMLGAAQAQGVRIRVKSSYRSYSEQATTFQFWVDRLGEAQARRESATPGNSEHQLGTTADVISANSGTGWELVEQFGALPEGKWVAAHAHEFGFAISYPPDGEAITGYVWEPWHVRYIGKPCAAEWQASGLTLVRFLERLASAR